MREIRKQIVGSGSGAVKVWRGFKSVAFVVTVKPQYVIDSAIHITDHRRLSVESNCGEKALVFANVQRHSDFHSIPWNFLRARTVLARL
jgi:hypothetical protein